MLISVVICAYKRPGTLREALDSLRAQTLSHDEYEVIVVDNNSGPPIPRLVREYTVDSPYRLKYVLEQSPGVSYARNAGIEHSSAEIVAFLDDDEVADPNWLRAHLDVHAEYPEVSAVVGKALPLWDTEQPTWLTDWRLIRDLNMVDWGDEPHPIRPPESLCTCNSSFQKSVFAETGLFDVRLKVGEDLDIQGRLERLGKTIYYTPDAVIHHHVKVDRVSKGFFYQRAFERGRWRAAGRTNATEVVPTGQEEPQENIGKWFVRNTILLTKKMLVSGLSEEGRVFFVRSISYALGLGYGTFRRRIIRSN